MSRTQAIEVLVQACLSGTLRAGSARQDAVSTIINKSLGREIDWFPLFYKVEAGKSLSLNDVDLIAEIEEKTGFTFDQIRDIESAFEGSVFVPGHRRVSMGRDETIEDRLNRVVNTILFMDKVQNYGIAA